MTRKMLVQCWLHPDLPTLAAAKIAYLITSAAAKQEVSGAGGTAGCAGAFSRAISARGILDAKRHCSKRYRNTGIWACVKTRNSQR